MGHSFDLTRILRRDTLIAFSIEVIALPGLRIKDNEPYDIALRRFKKQCEKSGILSELRRREFYEKPSVRKKKKSIAARKRALKRIFERR